MIAGRRLELLASPIQRLTTPVCKSTRSVLVGPQVALLYAHHTRNREEYATLPSTSKPLDGRKGNTFWWFILDSSFHSLQWQIGSEVPTLGPIAFSIRRGR
jgi:hypothetical protein